MALPNGIDLVAFADANYLLIEDLVHEAKQEGFELVQRTIADWRSGRVRHLYIRQARSYFHLLRLFTANPVATVFYERLGFEHLPGYKVSHVLTLNK